MQFRVYRAWGLGFRVWGLGFRVLELLAFLGVSVFDSGIGSFGVLPWVWDFLNLGVEGKEVLQALSCT